MALARVVVQESDLGAVCPPWETAPHGVVSLLTMLEFAAKDFVEISHRFGLVLGFAKRHSAATDSGTLQKTLEDSLQNVFGDLLKNGSNLGLAVTTEHLLLLLREHHQNATEEIKQRNIENVRRGEFVIGGQMDMNRAAYYAETLYSTMRAELSSMLFKAVPKERARYSNAEWLKNSVIESRFPTSFRELDRAGACYALGQPTASVFHSMRALEPGVSALAKSFGVSSTYDNWQNVIEQIESAVRSIGQRAKSQQKIDDEKFFGSATSHIYFVKNAWRNHVMHARDSYSDDEAVKILSHTLEFIESLCPRLQE
jgi:hypothetical protein